MKTVISGMLAMLCLHTRAQDSIPRPLEEVVVYSNKFAEKKKNIVQKIEVVTQQQIAQLNTQNTGDLLIHTGNVFVQKSQQGGSSPVIRGFEASRVLLVIDGIRMNNAIYRSGHLQNIITVDQNMLERVEVLYGPASTLYGSDALGGVVHMRTKLPALSHDGKTFTRGSALARFSSANNEKTGHFDFNVGGSKWGWLQAYNFSDFGDMKMGNRYPQAYPNFGRRTEYVAHVNGIDTILRNPDDRVQKFSGYQQWDVTQKFLYKPSSATTHQLNFQYSNTGNVPRYDRLQDRRNGNLRFAEWYYGPQLRQLAAYEFNTLSAGFFDEAKVIASFQKIRESRHQREYRRYDRQDNRIEDLNVWALVADGRKLWQRHELTVGADMQLNDVTSQAYRRNIKTGARAALDTRYPNGDNKMNYFGVYAQHLWKSDNGKWVVNDGLRLQSTYLRSTIADNSIFKLPFTEITQDHAAVTGNMGLVFMPSANTRITSGFSSGFRSPNIDDLAKIFESNTASRQIIVPNANIKPEYTYNADLGISHTLAQQLQVNMDIFVTRFKNAIALAPFLFDGQDSIVYNGVRSRVFANQNINKARLWGFHAGLTWRPAAAWRLYSDANYTYGRLVPATGGEIPLDHIPPIYGKTGIAYQQGRLSADFYALYNGWKRIEDYNPSGEDNAQYATPEGTPSWTTLNLKSSFSVNNTWQLQAGVENILDRNYRYFASGFSAPGRNIILALRASF